MIDFPTSPAVGTVVTSPNGNQWKWDGTAWQIMRNVGVQNVDTRGYTFYQDQAPASARVGDTLYQPTWGTSTVWNGSAWIQTGPRMAQITAPIGRRDRATVFWGTGTGNGATANIGANLPGAPFTGRATAYFAAQVGYNGITNIRYHVQFFSSGNMMPTGTTGMRSDYMTDYLAAAQWWAIPTLTLELPCYVGQQLNLTVACFNSAANSSWHLDGLIWVDYIDFGSAHWN